MQRARAVRRRRRPGAGRRDRGAPHAHRYRSRRAARRGRCGDAVHSPSLRQADHRLDARDRGARPRGRAGLLPPLLHARQRDPRRGRRRDRRRGSPLAEKTYGTDPGAGRGAGRVRRPQEPDPRAARRVSLADPKVEQPSLQRAWLVPSYLTAEPGEAEALDVLVQILGAQSTGRLHRRLVMEKRRRRCRRRLVPGHCARPLAAACSTPCPGPA